MLPPRQFQPSHLINTVFIAGVTQEAIYNILNKNDFSEDLTPEVLFSYPESKESITGSILEFVFSNGISVEYQNQPPKFNAIVLTNETGFRSYIYILKLYEEICYNNKSVFVPYSLCIWSPLNHSVSFKQILIEMYRVMRSYELSISDETLINYHNCEIIHMIVFLSGILIPSSYTKLILNFHFSKVEFLFNSMFEIPKNDNIKIMFDCLEISTIIKLWCSLLCEKHIILLGNQAYLLFAVCESLLSLIFPFKWLHTYIPILPYNQFDYLESPTPYMIGVLSSRVDYSYLNENYASHVICDINTSQINKNGVSFLSYNEESKLRKKLQYMKNPELFTIEDIFDSSEDKEKFTKGEDIEDIEQGRSFSENVCYIFFRIFRNSLNIMKKHFTNDKIFNVQSFLDEFCISDMRDFWEKVSATVAFEHFIMSFKNIDDSFSKIFKNITKSLKHQRDLFDNINQSSHTLLECQISLPNSLSYLIEQYEDEMMINELNSLEIDYSMALSHFSNQRMSISPKDKKIKWKRKCRNRIGLNNFSCDFDRMNQDLKLSTSMNGNNRVIINKMYSSTNNNNNTLTNSSEQNFTVSFQINKNTKNLFKLYASDSSIIELGHNKTDIIKQNEFDYNFSQMGFIGLANLLLSSVSQCSQFGYSHSFIAQINKYLQLKEDNDLKSNCSQITEQDKESVDSKTFLTLSNQISDNFNSNNAIGVIQLSHQQEIMTFSQTNCAQFYQIAALYKAEYQIIDSKEEIFKLFEKSYALNPYEFCRTRFYQFLDEFSYNELSLIANKLNIEHTFTNIKKFKKIISLKLTKMSKMRKITISNNNTSSNLYSKRGSQTSNLPLTSLNQNDEANLDIGDIGKQKSDSVNNRESTLLIKRKSTLDVRRLKSSLRVSKKISLANNDLDSLPRQSYVNDNYDGRTDGEHIIEILKANNEAPLDKLIKLNVINMYDNYICSDKDPLQLIEDIAVSIYTLIIKQALNKLKTQMISKDLLRTISTSNEFQHIKDLVSELQAIKLGGILKNDKFKSCFWINCYNFLTIFAIIYKKEVVLTYYEWYKFLKNSFFNIGGYEISLYEIENCILRSTSTSFILYGEAISFPKEDKRNELKILFPNKYIEFCIYVPTKSSPNLQIYFPNTLNKQITRNTIDYFNAGITVDIDKCIVNVPEYLMWIDDKFLERIDKYSEVCSKEFLNFLKKYKNKVNYVKHDFTLNFENSVS